MNWLPWTWFDVAKVALALPNNLLAFAPNDRSYHAVNLDIPVDSPVQERRVVRGFIMSGRNAKNLIKPRAPTPRKGVEALDAWTEKPRFQELRETAGREDARRADSQEGTMMPAREHS